METSDTITNGTLILANVNSELVCSPASEQSTRTASFYEDGTLLQRPVSLKYMISAGLRHLVTRR